MSKVNLETILNEKLSKSICGMSVLDSEVYNNIIKAMREACRQTLELASKNTEIDMSKSLTVGNGDMKIYNVLVNSKSILDVINLIE